MGNGGTKTLTEGTENPRTQTVQKPLDLEKFQRNMDALVKYAHVIIPENEAELIAYHYEGRKVPVKELKEILRYSRVPDTNFEVGIIPETTDGKIVVRKDENRISVFSKRADLKELRKRCTELRGLNPDEDPRPITEFTLNSTEEIFGAAIIRARNAAGGKGAPPIENSETKSSALKPVGQEQEKVTDETVAPSIGVYEYFKDGKKHVKMVNLVSLDIDSAALAKEMPGIDFITITPEAQKKYYTANFPMMQPDARYVLLTYGENRGGLGWVDSTVKEVTRTIIPEAHDKWRMARFCSTVVVKAIPESKACLLHAGFDGVQPTVNELEGMIKATCSQNEPYTVEVVAVVTTFDNKIPFRKNADGTRSLYSKQVDLAELEKTEKTLKDAVVDFVRTEAKAMVTDSYATYRGTVEYRKGGLRIIQPVYSIYTPMVSKQLLKENHDLDFAPGSPKELSSWYASGFDKISEESHYPQILYMKKVFKLKLVEETIDALMRSRNENWDEAMKALREAYDGAPSRRLADELKDKHQK